MTVQMIDNYLTLIFLFIKLSDPKTLLLIAYLMIRLRSRDIPVASVFADVLAVIDISQVPAVVEVPIFAGVSASAGAPIVANIRPATGVSTDFNVPAIVGFPDVVGIP
jgi:hypothetical protein